MTGYVYKLKKDQVDYDYGFRFVEVAVVEPVWESVLADVEFDIRDIARKIVIDVRHWARELLR